MYSVIFPRRLPFGWAQHNAARFAVIGREFACQSILLKPVSTD